MGNRKDTRQKRDVVGSGIYDTLEKYMAAQR